MNPWVLAAASGLGASWFLDAVKPLVSVGTKVKAIYFFCLDLVLWWTIVVVLWKFPSDGVAVASILLSLAIGKVAHAVTSFLQAAKDRNRMSVLSARRVKG